MVPIAADYAYDAQPKEMDAEGKVSFKGLEAGLYLVVQDAQGTGNNKLTITPFLITIPQKNPDGSLAYDVTAEAKPIGVAKEEVPPPPPPHNIPQTGQLWWPVALLGGSGMLLFCIGIIQTNKNR